jgi:ribosomal protein S21
MAVNVKVELRHHRGDRDHQSYEEREREFKFLMQKFRRAMSEAGVMQELRQRESYESDSRKRRRKQREADLARLKAKLKESFGRRGH